MERLVAKYARKAEAAGLAEEGAPLVGGLDDEIAWNRDDPAIPALEEVFEALNVNALMLCRPGPLYAEVVDYLAARAEGGAIRPEDSETRTFLHDFPVVPELSPGPVAAALRRRRSAVVPGVGVVASGTVSPEQAFVSFSSVLFSCFVKFLSDRLVAARLGRPDPEADGILARAWSRLEPLPEEPPDLDRGPFGTEEEIHRAMARAGRFTVRHRLVDSYFGNISYLADGVLHISQTSSSLDELEGCIDPCPLDGSATTGITASSELSAHRRIAEVTGRRAVLHGHPRLSVVLSMDCDDEECPDRGRCHTHCRKPRSVCGVPIVSGEIGTGRFGLCNTVPEAMAAGRGALVWGHGVFTAGRVDFRDAFAEMVAIERCCREEYARRLGLPPARTFRRAPAGGT